MPDQLRVKSSAHVLRLLGPPRVNGPDGIVDGALLQRHRLGLLALLALAPGALLPRDRLIGLLWPETEMAKARHLLNVAAHSIRKALGDGALRSEGDSLQLDLDRLWVDVLEFERAFRQASAAVALDLYRGPFLDGLVLPNAVEFEQWQQREAARLEQLYHLALEMLADSTARAKGTLSSLPLWRRRLACTPGDARVAMALMRALAESGDRAGALRVASDHAKFLESEFGVDADPNIEGYAATLKHPRVTVRPAPTCSEIDVPMTSIELAAEPPVDAQDIGDSIATVPPRRRRPLTRKLGVGLLASLGILWAVVHLAPQRPKAPLGNIRSVADHPDVDPAARAAWVRARFYLHRRTASDLDSCLREAELAIRIDPRFASGYAVKGACLFTSTYLATLSPVAAFSQAEDAASHALVLDPAHAGAHVVLAWVRAARDWDWNGAERYFRRAIELNPGFDYAHMDYGRFLSWLGRHDEALAEVRAAERISPTVPLVSHDMALALYLARRFDEAIAQAQHTIGLDSTYFLGHQRLAFGYASKGRYAEAIAAMEKAVALAPGYVRQQGFLGYVYARGGRDQDARRIRDALLAANRHSYVPPTAIAIIYLGLGQHDQALHWLTRACEDRDGELVLLKVWPVLDPLRRDRRFEKLLDRLKMP